ncbi:MULTISPECIES: hypothetical protein [unclassified Streptomyces]|uniref:hypothetical protein n=1 Tax=unclassified Streptomyces TaxID=2593676 RepID=UPI002E305622|nr:hypothetical protein [Streptomyces sp. NBC_01268]
MTPAASRFRRRAAAALLALLALAGCGIQKSDVVEAGAGAPVTVNPTGNPRMLLFFVGRDGRLMPVARDLGFHRVVDTGTGTTITEPPYRVTTDKVLGALIEGPDERERAAGITSRIAFHGAGEPHALRETGSDGRPRLTVRLTVRLQDLDPVAVRQLICTASYAEDLGRAVEVVVAGTDGPLPAARCETD